MNKYWVLEGRETVPVTDLMEWARRFETMDRHVANTVIGDVRVSTVFLGIDHSYLGPPPLLFESMIFGGQLDQEQRRYTTWDEAEAGHAELVRLVKGSLQ